jgi:uncharacterized alpha-E superfamily protein
MILSRTAASLYWLGRYVERADFTARLVQATVRLDVLSSRPAGEAAWMSALTVLDANEAYAATEAPVTQAEVVRYLTVDRQHPGSVARCLDMARDNARAVRIALSRDAWTAINRAWLLFERRAKPEAGTDRAMRLVEMVENETRGFEGAVHRMMRNPTTWLLRLGQAVERADNTARLLDVKYHILLPEGETVGGIVDRDQWTTILQTVSAVTAYRWLYSDGLVPANVIDLLLSRHEMPRSLAASVEEVVDLLNLLARATGRHGEADRMARARSARVQRTRTADVIVSGLHEHLGAFVRENAELHAAIGRQYRFA